MSRIPPFIPDHRLYLLDAPWQQRLEWLRPERLRPFEERRDFEGRPERGDDEYGWKLVGDRDALLTRKDIRRLCITVDAGGGKTTALKQAQYLRPICDPGHLAIRVEIGRLPDSVNMFLGLSEDAAADQRNTPLLVEELENQIPDGRKAWRLIQRKIREEQFTLIVDAFDQSRGLTNANGAVNALAAFLKRHREIRCIVAGRPYALRRYERQLFRSATAVDAWQFALLSDFTDSRNPGAAPEDRQMRRFVGEDRYAHIRRIGGDFLTIPRSLEYVCRLGPGQLNGLRTASDLYWRVLSHMMDEAYARQPELPRARWRGSCSPCSPSR